MALFAGSLLSANAQDHLSAYVQPGATKQLAIQLANGVEYTACQMKITLPESLTFAGDATLSNNRSDAHQIQSSTSSDNKTMTVAVFSYEEKDGTKKGNLAFKNAKGAVVLIPVTVTGVFKETSCDVSGITVSDVEFVKKSDLKGTALALTSTGKLGDVDGNGKLNTVDASLILMKLVGNSIPDEYDVEAEDVEPNGTLNTVDSSEILKELVR